MAITEPRSANILSRYRHWLEEFRVESTVKREVGYKLTTGTPGLSETIGWHKRYRIFQKSWLRRGLRSHIELALHAGSENFGSPGEGERGQLTSVPVILASLCLTLPGQGIILVVGGRLGRVLELRCRGRLGVRRFWPDEGLGVFWRRRLGVLGVLVGNRFVLDDHGGMSVASGLH